MGSFCLQKIEFLELLLVFFLDILRLVLFFSPFHDEFSLPWGVTWILCMDAKIKWGVIATFIAAVFMFLSLLGTLFDLHGVSVFIWGKLKLVSVLVLVVGTSVAVDHCRSCLVLLTGSFSDFYLAIIDSLAPGSTRDLTIRVLDCLYFLSAGMTISKKIIGLKWTCFSSLENLNFYPFYWSAFVECLIGKHDVMLHLSY